MQFLVKLPYVNKKILIGLILFIVLVLSMSPIIMKVVDKNLAYFDGSILHMLSHGMGQYLLSYSYIIFPLLGLIMIFLPTVILFLRKDKILILSLSMMLSSFIIGLFGFSSLVSGIPAYLLFFYIYPRKRKFQRLSNV